MAWRYQVKYGVTVAEVQEMRRQQLNSCAICREPFADDVAPHIDHDHSSGEVRGILCASCNKGLGHFRDDPARLVAAANYLNERKR